MFLNEICKNNRVLSTEALAKRIKETYKMRPNIIEDLRTLSAGYRGERELKYYLQFLPEKDCLLIHNLRLYDGKTYFQIDYLILTQRLALIVECKNYFGEVTFDPEYDQMIRKANGKEQGYSDPISQAKRHQRQLQIYLKRHNLPPIPSDFLVVFSNPSTIIRGYPAMKDKVIHGHSFLEKWDKLSAKFKTPAIDRKTLLKISKNLLKHNTPETVDLLKKYGIQANELITGVQCPTCGKLAMIRQKRKWYCPHCNTYDAKAHQKSVLDYFSLIKPTITNKEFRKFTHLSSSGIASKMLVKMNLPSKGKNKGRVYYKP
ncbi:NERD domain-containing protein [Niallia sp. JL1B1071]|uniref:NERD domain-containing protein n=1 Tax=Niallia tiangongensis TaxID=3237105 RepID=UPI0037DDA278